MPYCNKPGIRVLSDEFVNKVHDRAMTPDSVGVTYNVLHSLIEIIIEELATGRNITLDGFATLNYATKRTHSPRYRQWYDATRTFIIPKDYYRCNAYDLHEYVYELQWEDFQWNKRTYDKVAIWCQCRAMKLTESKRNKTLWPTKAKTIAEMTKGKLTEEEVIHYLTTYVNHRETF